MSYYIAHLQSGSGQPQGSTMEQAMDDIADYLTSETGYDWYTVGFSNTDITCNDGYSQDDSGEAAFVEDVMKDLESQDLLLPNDNVIITHTCVGFGYGGGVYNIALDGGGRAWGRAVYAGSWAHDWEVQGFTWHELAHGYGAAHADGYYKLYNDKMYDITPMCMSYLFSATGHADTQIQGANPGDPATPSSFCFGRPNGEYQFRYSVDGDCGACHDLTQYSYCTMQEIYDWISNH